MNFVAMAALAVVGKPGINSLLSLVRSVCFYVCLDFCYQSHLRSYILMYMRGYLSLSTPSYQVTCTICAHTPMFVNTRLQMFLASCGNQLVDIAAKALIVQRSRHETEADTGMYICICLYVRVHICAYSVRVCIEISRSISLHRLLLSLMVLFPIHT